MTVAELISKYPQHTHILHTEWIRNFRNDKTYVLDHFYFCSDNTLHIVLR